jgi:hypothetical protein
MVEARNFQNKALLKQLVLSVCNGVIILGKNATSVETVFLYNVKQQDGGLTKTEFNFRCDKNKLVNRWSQV